MIFVVGGSGGGLSIKNAVIHVKAPIGSTIDFSKGGVVSKSIGPDKAHPNSDGSNADYYYSVKSGNYGTWTITGTLDGDTATESVTVDAAYVYDVEIIYGYYWVKNGVLVNPMRFTGTTGFESNGEGYVYPKTSDTGWHAAYQDIDVSEYSVLSITYIHNAGAAKYIGMWDSSGNMTAYTTLGTVSQDTVATFDVSNLTGTRRVGLRFAGEGTYMLVKDFLLR